MGEEIERDESGRIARPDFNYDNQGKEIEETAPQPQKGNFDERGRYSGALADLELANPQEQRNPLEVTQEERQEIIEGIEARAAVPAQYKDLPTSMKELIDEEGWENILHEQTGVDKHLSHDEQDQLQDAFDSLPTALHQKLTVALASGEFQTGQEVVDYMADGLTAKQMGHLRRAIDELPEVIRDAIDI